MGEGGEVVIGHRRGARWRSVAHGVHRSVQPGRPAAWLEDLRALQLVIPASACFTHLTAAAVLGLRLPPLPAGLPVHLSMPKGEERPRRKGLRVARLNMTIEPNVIGGLRVAPTPEVLLACARDLGVLDLVVLVDSALRAGLCAAAEIGAVAAPRRRGAPTLRAALELADPRAESAWESVLRVFHVLCGVPVEPQRVVLDEAGRFVARSDLWVVGTRTMHEYDGAVHRDRRTHLNDLARERAIVNAGWVRRGYTSTDLLGRGHVMLREADAALGRSHDPGRLEPWRRALNASLFSRDGRAGRRQATWRERLDRPIQ